MAKSMFNAKIAFGDINNINKAIENGIVDERDLVISNLKSLPSLYIIDDNKQPKRLLTYIQTFDSTPAANEWLNSIHTEVMDGQPIAILSSNKLRYDLYIVRVMDGKYGLTPVSDVSQIEMIQEHINNTENPHKVTLKQLGLTPMSDDEVRSIVDIIYNMT